MVQRLAFFVYRLLVVGDNLFFRLTNRRILHFFYDFIQSDAYKSVTIFDKDIKLFAPNHLVKWRVDTFFTKEPETLEWIDQFDSKGHIVFWDIGANIGLYSMYAALRHKSIEVVSFEPSTSNLRILSRNISVNQLEDQIKIVPFPLSNKENRFMMMKEGDFVEGGALNSFGVEFDFKGERFESNNSYQTYGTSINYLLRSGILGIPDYVKIDVDGIEHLILEGADEYFHRQSIKSISIEINENFDDQFQAILMHMRAFRFQFRHKKNAPSFVGDGVFAKTFNYVFDRDA